METAESLPEAVAFANRQFGLDFLQFQSKIYCDPGAGQTFSFRKDGRIVGMVSVYPVEYQDMRCLSIGTVCTDSEFQGQGIMTSLFEYLQNDLFPDYDILTLCGKRARYERFGFAKAMLFPEYWFYPQTAGSLQIFAADEDDNPRLYSLWNCYGNGVKRTEKKMLNILKSSGHDVQLLSDGTQWGYIAWKRGKQLIAEYCGPWPVQLVVDAIAPLIGGGKIGIVGMYNRHDKKLLHSCDSYLIRNYGNVRIRNADIAQVYDIFGYGDKEPGLILPTSLFFMDGI